MNKTLNMTLKITFMAVYAAVVYALQVALASLPNIEMVTLMLSIAGLCMPRRMSLTIAIVFVVLEGLTYGFGDWMLLYAIVWPGVVLLFSLFKRFAEHAWVLVVIFDSLIGFAFGSIDAATKYVLYGPSTMLAYWIRGLLFDVMHGVSNFVIAFVCFKAIYAIVDRFCQWYIPERKKTKADFKLLGFNFQVTKNFVENLSTH